MTIRRTKPINTNDPYVSHQQPPRDNATPQVLAVIDQGMAAA